jgi:hypothetical protein
MIVVAHHADTVLATMDTVIGARLAVVITMKTAAAMVDLPRVLVLRLMTIRRLAVVALKTRTAGTTPLLTHMSMAMADHPTTDPLQETTLQGIPVMPIMIVGAVTGNFSPDVTSRIQLT